MPVLINMFIWTIQHMHPACVFCFLFTGIAIPFFPLFFVFDRWRFTTSLSTITARMMFSSWAQMDCGMSCPTIELRPSLMKCWKVSHRTITKGKPTEPLMRNVSSGRMRTDCKANCIWWHFLWLNVTRTNY